ncbi:Hypothetical predicted protein [Mytilus galloprovincialis]|nr:Hypothetical predicted protein [Mytilus galloprovincialis]
MYKHLIVCVLWMMILSVNCTRKTYHLIKLEGDKKIHQDVVHDIEGNTVTITVGDVSMYNGKIATVNFHDFDTGYVVFKNINRQLCLLSVSPIPYATPLIYELRETNLTLNYRAKIDEDFISLEKVEEMAGGKIASFCSDYKVHFMHLTLFQNSKRNADSDNLKAPCEHNCGICFVSIPAADYESLTIGKRG